MSSVHKDENKNHFVVNLELHFLLLNIKKSMEKF